MQERRTRCEICSSAALLLAILLLCAGLAGAERQAAPQAAASPGKTAAVPTEAKPAEKIVLPGLPNFGRVTPKLYRGGQPKPAGYAELKKLGVEIVVNFRTERSKIEAERRAVEALGLRYVSIPWSSAGSPAHQQVAEFLDLLRANPDRQVFVHCRRGAERTGVMIAVFRMAAQNWTAEQAAQEMEEFKFRGLWFSHLKRYVRNFSKQPAADPNLRGLAPATQLSAP